MSAFSELIAALKDEGGRAAFFLRGGSCFDGIVESVDGELLIIRSLDRLGNVGRHYLALSELAAVSVLVHDGADA